MISKRIIPCLDVNAGRVVKGVNFVNLRDAGDPVECAREYDRQGADELVFLDITASHEKRKTIVEVVEKTADQVFIPLTVGGGVNEVADIRTLLVAGADKVSINTQAVKRPLIITEGSDMFGSQCIVAAIDVKRSDGFSADHQKWDVYIHGGRTKTDLDAFTWMETLVSLGAGEFLLTSMDKDGTRSGFDLELYRRVSRTFPIPVIASGGAGNILHMHEVLLTGEADAVLAASIFHDKDYTVSDVKRMLRDKGLEVRL